MNFSLTFTNSEIVCHSPPRKVLCRVDNINTHTIHLASRITLEPRCSTITLEPRCSTMTLELRCSTITITHTAQGELNCLYADQYLLFIRALSESVRTRSWYVRTEICQRERIVCTTTRC